MMFGFFFFKQKTAYEMRISDWSSDMCSSDLYRYADIEVVNAIFARQIGGAGQNPLLVLQICLGHFNTAGGRRIESRSGLQQADRSEERRVGQACGSSWKSRGEPVHEKNKENKTWMTK